MSTVQSHGGLMEPPLLFPQKRPRSPGPGGGTPRGSQHPGFGGRSSQNLLISSADTWPLEIPQGGSVQAGGEQHYCLASLQTQASSEAVFLELVSSPSSPWAPQQKGCTLRASNGLQVPKRYTLPALSLAHKSTAAHPWHKGLAPALEVGSPSPSSLSYASCRSSCPSRQSSLAPHNHASGSLAPTSQVPGTPTTSHMAGPHWSSSTPTSQHTVPTPSPRGAMPRPPASASPLLICTASCASSDLDADPSAVSSFAAASSFSSFSSSSFSASPAAVSHGASSIGAPLGLHRLHSAGLSRAFHETNPSWPLDERLQGGKGVEGMGWERDPEEGSCCSGSADSMDEDDDAASPHETHPQSHVQSQPQSQLRPQSQWPGYQRTPQLDRSGGGSGSLAAPTPPTAGLSPGKQCAGSHTLPPLAFHPPRAAPPPTSQAQSNKPHISCDETNKPAPCSLGAWQVGPWSLVNTSNIGLPTMGSSATAVEPYMPGGRVPSSAALRRAEHLPSVDTTPLPGLLSRALRAVDQHGRGEAAVHREGEMGYSILVDLNSEPGVDREELARSRREILGTRHGTPSRKWLNA